MARFLLDREGRLRTPWRVTVFFVAYLVVSVLGGLAAGVVLALAGFGKARSGVAEFVFVFGAVALQLALSFGLVVVFRLFVDRRSLRSLGLQRPDHRPTASAWVGLAMGAGAAALPILLMVALGPLRIDGFGSILAVPAVAAVLVLAAFHEEIVFRGYILVNVIEAGAPWAAVAVSSILFVTPHMLNPHFWQSPFGGANILLASVALALAYMLSGNIWFPTALHFGWNAAQSVLFGLPVSGFPTSGLLSVSAESSAGVPIARDFGLEGSLPGTVSVLLLTVFLGLLLHRRRTSASAAGAGNGSP